MTIVAAVVGLLVIGGGVVALVGKGISSATQGRTFSGTQGDAQDKFGDGAKVVKIENDGGGVEYDVLSPDNSTVLIRNYTVTSEDLGGGTSGYNNHTDASQRAARPAEVKGVTVTLGQLDKDMVDRRHLTPLTRWRTRNRVPAGRLLTCWRAEADPPTARRRSS